LNELEREEFHPLGMLALGFQPRLPSEWTKLMRARIRRLELLAAFEAGVILALVIYIYLTGACV
jgi:hypothetical protein